jgi:hypothetical protein
MTGLVRTDRISAPPGDRLSLMLAVSGAEPERLAQSPRKLPTSVSKPREYRHTNFGKQIARCNGKPEMLLGVQFIIGRKRQTST